jgi:hypothetical protein
VNCAEPSKPLSGETRQPLPARPGQAARYDSESKRKGTRNLFLVCEPQAGWRHGTVTEQRTMQDFAPQRQGLVAERSPDAEVIRVVLDTLTTHKPASLYATLPAAQAPRLRQKVAFPSTPKPESGLNLAEIELSVLARQCLQRRIAPEATLNRELAAVEATRNAARATLNWQLTTGEARVTLHSLYPSTSL